MTYFGRPTVSGSAASWDGDSFVFDTKLEKDPVYWTSNVASRIATTASRVDVQNMVVSNGATITGSLNQGLQGNVFAYGENSHAEGGSQTGMLGYSIDIIAQDFDNPSNYIFTINSSYGDVTSSFSSYPQAKYLIANDPLPAGPYSNTVLIHSYVGANYAGGNTHITASEQFDFISAFSTVIARADTVTQKVNAPLGGQYTHAEGTGSIAVGKFSHTEGWLCVANGFGSHAEGGGSVALGESAHAEGVNTLAFSQGSHSEGINTVAYYEFSHAEGYDTRTDGPHCHSEGYGTVASYAGSHSEGKYTLASGEGSHAEGYFTTGSGAYSHAEGSGSITFGLASHAEGLVTIASGAYSHTEGWGTVSSGSYQHVQGKWNLYNNDFSLFVIGDGTNNASRSDIVRVNSGSTGGTGRLEVTGSLGVTVGMTGSLSYTPGDGTYWADPDPTNVKDALDRIASLLYTLNSNTPIP